MENEHELIEKKVKLLPTGGASASFPPPSEIETAVLTEPVTVFQRTRISESGRTVTTTITR